MHVNSLLGTLLLSSNPDTHTNTMDAIYESEVSIIIVILSCKNIANNTKAPKHLSTSSLWGRANRMHDNWLIGLDRMIVKLVKLKLMLKSEAEE